MSLSPLGHDIHSPQTLQQPELKRPLTTPRQARCLSWELLAEPDFMHTPFSLNCPWTQSCGQSTAMAAARLSINASPACMQLRDTNPFAVAVHQGQGPTSVHPGPKLHSPQNNLFPISHTLLSILPKDTRPCICTQGLFNLCHFTCGFLFCGLRAPFVRACFPLSTLGLLHSLCYLSILTATEGNHAANACALSFLLTFSS